MQVRILSRVLCNTLDASRNVCYNIQMNSKWTKPENEDRLRLAAKNNKSIAGMCRDLGLAPRGGNIATIRHHVVRLEIDVTHHTGQGWNRENYKSPFDPRTNATAKSQLIRDHGHACWVCELSEWMGQPIPLDMDHIDGNNRNNSPGNLRLLCLNCHGQTPTFKNRKRPSAYAPVSQLAEENGSNPL